MILSKISYGSSKAILSIASNPTSLNHSQPTPEFDPPNHQKHPQQKNQPTNMKIQHKCSSNLHASPNIITQPTIDLLSRHGHNHHKYCYPQLQNQKKKMKKKTNILALDSMYPSMRLTSGARSEATH